MDTEVLKKYCSKENLSNYEVLWLTYAKDLGLDISLLNSIIKKKNEKIYFTIEGLIWKYEKILNRASQLFENNLYVVLKRTVYTEEAKITEITNNTITISGTLPNNLYSSATTNPYGFSRAIPLSAAIPNTICYASSNVGLTSYTSGISLEKPKSKELNEEIDKSYLDDTDFVNLENLIKNYTKLDGSIIGENINYYPKFKIVIEKQ